MPDPKVAVVPNTPIGTRETLAFVTRESGCGVETLKLDVFSDEDRARGEALRERRVAAGLCLGQAADFLGLRAVDLSGLERGRMRFADPEAAEAAIAREWEGQRG